MKKKWWLFLLIPPAMVLFGWMFGEIVMHLWNGLMPALFGLRMITFWQAFGLLILCRILVGGLGPGGGSNNQGPAEIGRALGVHDARRAREVSRMDA